ncbi:MAG: LPS-assembly protein LptD [Selenomonadaceae bacterium]|nr:LPS-assembly protein LptD [Selenomonadaceae bacterium]
MSKKIFSAAALFGLSIVLTCFAEPNSQPSPPQELNADDVEYDMETGLARATGSVKINRGKSPNDPNSEESSLAADQVDYNMNDGTITAEGNVLLRYGNGTATGTRAMYNTNTQEAYLIGNVIVVRDGFRLTCNQLINDGYGHMQADGNVYGEQKVEPTPDKPEGDLRSFQGDHVDYYPDDRQHFVIPTGGIAKSYDGTFTADFMEGWIDDQYYVGQGNAHLVSPPRQLEAGGDRIDYYANENGKAVLSGNAWAIQENNRLKGRRVTVYLADEPKKPSTPGTAPAVKPDIPSAQSHIRPFATLRPDEPIVDAPFDQSVDQSVEKKIVEEKSEQPSVDEKSVEQQTTATFEPKEEP